MKVLVEHKEALNEFEKKDDLFGSQGFCIVQNGFLQKIYFEPRNSRCMTDLSIYKSDLIAFPLYYLYDKSNHYNIIGEMQKYYPKKSIYWSIDESVYIKTLLKNYYDMVKEICKYPEIVMHDLFTANILYDDISGFNLIDTTDWKIDNTNNERNNLKKFNGSIVERLIFELLEISPYTLYNTNFCENLRRYGNNGELLISALHATLLNDYQISDILNLYQLLGKESDFGSINSINDIKKYTKKIKNS